MNNTTTRKKFSLFTRLIVWWSRQREADRRLGLRKRCPPATVAAEQIPLAIRAAWAHHGPHEFPGLPVDDGSWLRCTIGLAQFFVACRLQPGACALPSRAADSVWHVWLKADPVGLAGWQQRHFGRVIEHREVEMLGVPLEEGLARTWAGACRSEGQSLIGPRLPLIFALDGLVRVPSGWAYGHEGGTLVHRSIDGFGRVGGHAVEHAALAGGGLVALGLLSEAELKARRRKQADGGGSDWSVSGFGGGDSSSCDAGGSSGDSGGGSSCGSSCGGGD